MNKDQLYEQYLAGVPLTEAVIEIDPKYMEEIMKALDTALKKIVLYQRQKQLNTSFFTKEQTISRLTVPPEARATDADVEDYLRKKSDEVERDSFRSHVKKVDAIFNRFLKEFNIILEGHFARSIRRDPLQAAAEISSGRIGVSYPWIFLIDALRSRKDYLVFMNKFWEVLSHELVHREQAIRAKGVAKGTDVGWSTEMEEYLRHPQEIMAHALSAVEALIGQGLDEDDILEILRRPRMARILDPSNSLARYAEALQATDPAYRKFKSYVHRYVTQGVKRGRPSWFQSALKAGKKFMASF